MLSWLGKILGTKGVLDAVIKSGDALIETPEEHKSWLLNYIRITGNIARRFIALIIVGLWALTVLITFVTGYFDDETAKIQRVFIAEVITDPFLVVLGFYFLKHTVAAGVANFSKSSK